jgi:hypothetical protein
VKVVPSAACAVQSLASVVSVATVGVSSTFFLEIKDSFSNIRPCESFQWVQFFSMEPIPGSYSVDGLRCHFSFVPSISTVGYSNVLVNDAFVLQQPLALVVLSGRLDLYRSVVQFSSLVTAGVPASFAISFFDSVNNSKDLQTLYSSVELSLHSSQSGLQLGTVLQSNLASLTNTPDLYFVVTVSAQFSVSVKFMGAPFSQLQLVVVPSSACAATSFAVGDAVSVATNGKRSQFHIQLRDLFGNAAFLQSSEAVFAYSSTSPRFSCASVMQAPLTSRIPISLNFKHARSDSSFALPQMVASLAFSGGLTAT